MGGPGSGRWIRWDKKSTVGDSCAIDINQLVRAGLMQGGDHARGNITRESGEVTHHFEIDISDTDNASLRLAYPVRDSDTGAWRSATSRIPLTATQQSFGGCRWWFRCPQPDCGRRAAVLYRPVHTQHYGCRQCRKRVYESQRENRLYRALRRARRARKRLGGQPHEPIPDRPKGMWRETYYRLREEIEDAEFELWDALRMCFMPAG